MVHDQEPHHASRVTSFRTFALDKMYAQTNPFMGYPDTGMAIDSPPVTCSDDQTHGSTVPDSATTTLSPSSPLNLTFGVEFEFIVVYDRDSYPANQDIEDANALADSDDYIDPVGDEYNRQVRKRMVEVLRHAGIAVNDYNSWTDYSRWTGRSFRNSFHPFQVVPRVTTPRLSESGKTDSEFYYSC